MTARRTTVTTEIETLPTWSIPRGRSRAEQRLAAVAALHQPIPRTVGGTSVRGVVLEEPETYFICGECKTTGKSYDGAIPVRWPCTTARLLGEWPRVARCDRMPRVSSRPLRSLTAGPDTSQPSTKSCSSTDA